MRRLEKDKKTVITLKNENSVITATIIYGIKNDTINMCGCNLKGICFEFEAYNQDTNQLLAKGWLVESECNPDENENENEYGDEDEDRDEDDKMLIFGLHSELELNSNSEAKLFKSELQPKAIFELLKEKKAF